MKKLLLVFVFSFYSVIIFGKENVIRIEKSTDFLNIGDKVEILRDSAGTMNIYQVRESEEFEKSEIVIPNLGVSNSIFWVRVSVENYSDHDDWALEINYSNLDYISFYSFDDQNNRFDSLVLGESQPYSIRAYDDPAYIFDLALGKSERKEFYLAVKSGEQILLPIRFLKQKNVLHNTTNKSIVMGIYMGIMLVMILYNFFIFLTVRDLSYLYYVVYIIFIAFAQITLQGYSFKLFWPNSAYLAKLSIYICSSLSGIALVLFVNNFLSVKRYIGKIIYVSYFVAFLYLVNIFVAISGAHNTSTHILDLGAGLVTLYSLAVAVWISIKGDRTARFFLLSWSVFIIGVVIFVLRNSGVLPMNSFTNYTMTFGTAIETILLSFALADRINILKRETEQSQMRELKMSQENERLVREQNVMLEQKVDERTIELKQTNNDLNTTLKNLKETQAQLVDAEKMASLGQLTAGIAHEINNPINFVTSNIKPLKRDIEDLLSLIEGFESEVGGHEELMGKINELKEEYDYEYVIEEVESLLQGIDDGAQRTAEIVRGLKNFSRLDEGELKKANINEGLTSTLTVLNSSIMGTSVKLVKDLDPNIPETECYPGKLNQVFMNIITNAIQAVNDNGHEKGKSIDITTRLENELIKISIKDNGCGMPDSVKEKIFEPFFTTKDVGEGTGLGLSIVQGIIEAHQGEINIITEQGTGTEFLISLPLKTS